MMRRTVLLIVGIAALAAGFGAAAALVVTSTEERGTKPTATSGRVAAVTVKQAQRDLGTALTKDVGVGPVGINSATCQAVDETGHRFRCDVAFQRGTVSSGGAPADNGTYSRYGLTPGQGAEYVAMVATYSNDGEQLSWSPGGGAALVEALRDLQRLSDESSTQSPAASTTGSDASDEDPAQDLSGPTDEDDPPVEADAPSDSADEADWARCGEIKVEGATAPGQLVALGMSCAQARRSANRYASDGALPSGWDAGRDCGVSRVSCQHGSQGFSVEDE